MNSHQSLVDIDKLENAKDISQIHIKYDVAKQGYMSYQMPLKENVYAGLYINEQNEGFIDLIKNGDKYLTSNRLSNNYKFQSLFSCEYNEDAMLVVFTGYYIEPGGTQSPDTVIGVKVKDDGTIEGMAQEIVPFNMNGQFNAKCQQISGNKFWITWSEQIDAGDVDVLVTNVDLTNTMPSIQTPFKVNSSKQGFQENSSVIQLKGPNSTKGIVAWSGQGAAIVGASVSGIYYSIIDETQNNFIVGSNFLVKDTEIGAKYCTHPSLKALDDGGFILVFSDRNSQSIYFARYSSDINNGTRECMEKINTKPGFRPTFTTHEGVAYIVFNEANGTASNIIAVEVDIKTCTKKSDPPEIVVHATDGIGHPIISINPQATNTITIGIQFLGTFDAFHKIRFTEFFIHQKTECNPHKQCVGCFGSKSASCPICRGTDYKERQIRKKADGDCSCIDGYIHQDGELNCQKCHNKCVTCQVSTTQCVACKGTTRSSPPDCLCNTHFFDDGSSDDCIECNSKCKECKNSKDNCIECFDITTRILPSCGCKPSYYDANEPKCYECDIKCKDCEISKDNCTQCADPVWRPMALQCICDIGSADVGQALCKVCHANCKVCLNDPNNCLLCVDNNVTRDYKKQCACKEGFYESGADVCFDQCAPQCSDCVNSISNCTKCSSRKIEPPLCSKCEEGYYGEGVNVTCKQCSSKCKTCRSYDLCNICTDLSQLPPNCDKPINGYFSVALPNGTYLDKECHPFCNTCEIQFNNCLSCAGQFRSSNPPLCPCLQGFYAPNETTPDCVACQPGCTQCRSLTICTECSDDRVLTGDGSCICKPDFQLVGNSCEKQCGKNKFRNEFNECGQCYYYKDSVCLSLCPSNTKQNSSTFECEEDDVNYFLIIAIIGIFLIALLILFFMYFREHDKKKWLNKKLKEQKKQRSLLQKCDSKNVNLQYVKHSLRKQNSDIEEKQILDCSPKFSDLSCDNLRSINQSNAVFDLVQTEQQMNTLVDKREQLIVDTISRQHTNSNQHHIREQRQFLVQSQSINSVSNNHLSDLQSESNSQQHIQEIITEKANFTQDNHSSNDLVSQNEVLESIDNN